VHISPRMLTLLAFLVFVAWMTWLTVTKKALTSKGEVETREEDGGYQSEQGRKTWAAAIAFRF
jgi:hypothetical protein